MLTVEEEQNIELEIMKQIHDFCVDNNLRYLLYAGSMLGAIRHKGFIPWDNDMDILMPRNDYEKFIELTKDKGFGDDLYIKHYTLDEKYHYHCMRVCDSKTKVNVPYIYEQPTNMGIWVDIFPVDGFCNNKFYRKLQKIQLDFYRIIFTSTIYKANTLLKKTLKPIINTIFDNSKNQYLYKIDKVSKRYPFEKYKTCFRAFGGRWINMDKDEFNNPKLYKFEKYEFYGFNDFDKFLKGFYGDYMKLPPEKDRKIHLIDAEYVNN